MDMVFPSWTITRVINSLLIASCTPHVWQESVSAGTWRASSLLWLPGSSFAWFYFSLAVVSRMGGWEFSNRLLFLLVRSWGSTRLICSLQTLKFWGFQDSAETELGHRSFYGQYQIRQVGHGSAELIETSLSLDLLLLWLPERLKYKLGASLWAPGFHTWRSLAPCEIGDQFLIFIWWCVYIIFAILLQLCTARSCLQRRGDLGLHRWWPCKKKIPKMQTFFPMHSKLENWRHQTLSFLSLARFHHSLNLRLDLLPQVLLRLSQLLSRFLLLPFSCRPFYGPRCYAISKILPPNDISRIIISWRLRRERPHSFFYFRRSHVTP